MVNQLEEPFCRVALIFDLAVWRDYAFMWAEAHAALIEEELSHRWFDGELVRIDVLGWPYPYS